MLTESITGSYAILGVDAILPYYRFKITTPNIPLSVLFSKETIQNE
jgi:hypothetical protein